MTKVIETNQNNDSYDYSISMVRCVATILIVMCHMMQWADIELAWWFNVGVQIFFCMSGFLYANKKIESSVDFYRKTFRKILVDYWIVLILVLPVYFVFQKDLIFVPYAVRMLLTARTISGGSHLWFIPYILLCYFFTPFLNEFISRNSKRGGVRLVLWCGMILLLNLFVTVEFFGRFESAWLACYIIGIAIGKFERENKEAYRLIICIVVVFAITMNTIQILTDYTQINLFNILTRGRASTLYGLFCNYAHAFLGVSLFVLLKTIFAKLLGYKHLCGRLIKVAKLSDQYSYDVYLVHHWIILGPFSLMGITTFPILNVLLILVLIIAMAFVVKHFSNNINRAMDKKLLNQEAKKYV